MPLQINLTVGLNLLYKTATFKSKDGSEALQVVSLIRDHLFYVSPTFISKSATLWGR